MFSKGIGDWWKNHQLLFVSSSFRPPRSPLLRCHHGGGIHPFILSSHTLTLFSLNADPDCYFKAEKSRGQAGLCENGFLPGPPLPERKLTGKF